MDKSGNQSKEIVAKHANKLPHEIVGRFLQNLSVGDRLKSEGVSPLWKLGLSKWGWTEQKKLDYGIVFEDASGYKLAHWEPHWEASELQIGRFRETPEDGNNCNFSSLLCVCDPWLRELDLTSFGYIAIERSLSSLNALERLDIHGENLGIFVEHFPSTLRVLKITGHVDFGNLEKLSVRCPNLEEVPFGNLFAVWGSEATIKLVGKFPRQKKLHLACHGTYKVGALASIGHLKDLEEVKVYSLDGESLEAIVAGCQRIRSVVLDTEQLTEEALFQLANMSNLVELDVRDQSGKLTDAVLEAIARCGQLKKLRVSGFGVKLDSISDRSICYLVDRCKSLVSLEFNNCPRISERSLEVVVAEVKRRHGVPPRSLPNGPLDDGVFYFYRNWNPDGHIRDRAEELIGDNPWIRFAIDPREII